jgi:hypothetical protein
MLRVAEEYRIKPEAVIPLSVRFFVKQCGLKLKHQGPDSAQFEGGEGGITLRASATGKKTEVEIMSIDMEKPVMDFLEWLKKK